MTIIDDYAPIISTGHNETEFVYIRAKDRYSW